MTIIASSQLIIVIGLGSSGLSVARFLQKQGLVFSVMDSRENAPNVDQFRADYPHVSLFLGAINTDYLLNADEIILSPGVSLKTPEIQLALEAGIPVVGDIELFARYVKKPVIAITGSNAKTTVTTLVGEMAKASGINVAIGGNIGRPALNLLDDDADLYILELSSFQLETTTSLKPLVATVLNVTEDHMDRYDSFVEYFRSKQRIYWGAENIVFNRDDSLTQPPVATGVGYFSFGSNRPDRNEFGFVEKNQETHLAFEFTALMSAQRILLKGKHNVLNGLAAFAIGHIAKFDQVAMIKVLETFEGLPHRCQWVAAVDSVDYINDSKATNVGASLAAIKGFGVEDRKNIILIAGGVGKDADFSPLNDAVNLHVRRVILIGANATDIEKALDNKVDVIYAENLVAAVALANKQANKGDVVLLSPACASFDMFSGYEERGDVFVHAVESLAA